MSTVIEPTTLQLPADVEAFAKEQDVFEYVPALWDAVVQLFPNADISIELQRDPEISGLGWIVFSVNKSGLESREISSARNEWRETRAKVCANPDSAMNFTLQIRD